MTDHERLKQIEALQAENARLQRIANAAGYHPLPIAYMPNAEQLVRLHGMVVSTYPVLRCSQVQFERSMLALAYARRQGKKLNTEFYAQHWADEAKAWLKRNGHNPEITLHAFTAAVIASGIPFAYDEDRRIAACARARRAL